MKPSDLIKSKTTIKTSKHSINHLNSGKQIALYNFIDEYSFVTNCFIDYIWNNKIEWKTKSKDNIETIHIFDIKNDLLDCPSMLSTVNITLPENNLSGRAIKCSITQALGIINSHIDKRKRLLFVFNKMKSNKQRTRKIVKKLNKNILVRPNIKTIYPELNSICCKFEESKNIKFDGVITLSSLGKIYGKIIIPINLNKHSNKLNGNLLNSFQISKEKIYFRWKENLLEKKQSGNIVGADTGINKIVTLSDGSRVGLEDIHGHTLNSILQKLVKKKKGSKGFRKTLDHRDNFINNSINKINFQDIKQINIEEIKGTRYKINNGKFLSLFPEGQIQEKLITVAIEHGVHVQLQDSSYRSQRCSSCGYVHKSNRKKELFSCKHCGFQTDADYNASCNHEQKLPSAANIRRCHPGQNRAGFFWKEDGFRDQNGSELAVPDTKKVRIGRSKI